MERAPVLEPLDCVRVVTTPAALAGAAWSPEVVVLRTAPDEAIVVGSDVPPLDDPHAIIESDRGWHGAWVEISAAETFLASAADWSLPEQRPALAQGMVAGLSVKVWIDSERALFVVSHTVADELIERLPPGWLS